MHETTFIATIPPIQSAYQINGDDGARIKLDIPESELANVLQLLMARGKQIRITAEWEGG